MDLQNSGLQGLLVMPEQNNGKNVYIISVYHQSTYQVAGDEEIRLTPSLEAQGVTLVGRILTIPVSLAIEIQVAWDEDFEVYYIRPGVYTKALKRFKAMFDEKDNAKMQALLADVLASKGALGILVGRATMTQWNEVLEELLTLFRKHFDEKSVSSEPSDANLWKKGAAPFTDRFSLADMLREYDKEDNDLGDGFINIFER
ncbi:hypothetical protein A2382_02900 [Candidatus Woesebacteria bacterium RIFOXYB1_FULL_38_16]|uniref:Uncharacterized protein n=1 Tax=Candidatus Woesebacteria bacterium RIFOXYB1_FULL_38_16 TaxID=1802538 RepID=A0A1F8CSV7_9BACT|nr:MAG: hypothetical protein A2191_04745 [Candidatus Woesebacteria bacterium RIFOXYA1_FULL_38_9]OGM79156.1 MAG: hypothetical protein A2382_02900 [Candidatus Woesebacteria bacterium RIFOXYB1_FULL_38_16]